MSHEIVHVGLREGVPIVSETRPSFWYKIGLAVNYDAPGHSLSLKPSCGKSGGEPLSKENDMVPREPHKM